MTVHFALEAGVATITLDRPERLNALSSEMKDMLLERLQFCARDEAVRVVVLRGTDKAFCSGADVTSMSEPTIPDGRQRLHAAHRIIKAIVHMEKPVIAAVAGVATGIGWSLALAADFILAAPTARFGQVFRKIGLAPDGGSVYLLTQYVGVLRAKELTMTARLVGGEEAFRLGLVTELVDGSALHQRADALARELADAAGLAMGMTKRLFLATGGSDLDRFLEFESHVQNQLIQTQDHAEGVRAFLGKRKPMFKGL
ncbi:MAG: enoyl-CoA hydratase/isomerase family protein [Alicycliphilus denitrificans]|nr:enoyl-CoA hydratase/isomerase family protein [Alicycliphilus denitrificans]